MEVINYKMGLMEQQIVNTLLEEKIKEVQDESKQIINNLKATLIVNSNGQPTDQAAPHRSLNQIENS